MWRYRLGGSVLASIGGTVIGYLWSEAAGETGNTGLIFRFGMPCVLLIALVNTISLIYGTHLLLAPRWALRPWTPRIVRNHQLPAKAPTMHHRAW